MFSEIVCSFFPWGSLYDVISCLAAWCHVPSRRSLSLVPCSFQGVSVQGVSVQGVSDQGVSDQGVSLQESLSRGQGLCPEGGISVQRGVSFQRGHLSRGGLCPEGALSTGESLSRGSLCSDGVFVGRPPPKNQKSGWYTSYWNTFLFISHGTFPKILS